ncbi:lactonase family protein [Methylobacterium sp. J-048]|uniref:lactonase family protein n=1 Tax=Methylobacterium sp. J-048 TaxID=2836635 RepID=UPI001FBB3E3C|nr:beta-propeller fold lactonase family protein [Methylobacterium sp. J-048]MCJ2058499.1 lactonase family protein [Methylobacterium sp. J-048]
MIARRTILTAIAGSIAAPTLSAAQPATGAPSSRLALYANVGPDLIHYDVDVEAATLTRRGTVTLPDSVQYAWPHRSRRFLYVVTSSTAPGNGAAPSNSHHLVALRIGDDGALTPHGAPVVLPTRPIHMSTDIPSENILVAFNKPSTLRVYRIRADCTLGEEVRQTGPVEAGIYAHQVRVTPDNKTAILVTRGNEGTAAQPEEPGALKVFDYAGGQLSHEISIAPDGGRNFGPRHLDFHPSRPWIYLSIETQNQVCLLHMADGKIGPDLLFRTGTLAEPGKDRARQAAGPIHVHPNGRFLYGSNRAEQTEDVQGTPVFKGGENGIVVYDLDMGTGEPKPIQHVDTRGIHPRTFHIDPSGRILVAEHNLPVTVRDGDDLRVVPAGLSVFRIGADGKLDFARKYDLDVKDQTMFWMGMVQS